MATASLLRAAESTASALCDVRYSLAAKASSRVAASAPDLLLNHGKRRQFLVGFVESKQSVRVPHVGVLTLIGRRKQVRPLQGSAQAGFEVSRLLRGDDIDCSVHL